MSVHLHFLIRCLAGVLLLNGGLCSQGGKVVSHQGQTTVRRSVGPFGDGNGGIVNGDFSDGLNGWTVSVAGSGGVPGSISELSEQAQFLEGDSFLVELSQSFVMPGTALTLTFDLFQVPGFELLSTSIPDAFEVSLLDAGSQSVVPTWAPFATSYFNLQETGAVNLGPSTTFDGTEVTLDLTAVPAGTPVVLIFTLIGGDGDVGSGVTIDDVVIDVVCASAASAMTYGAGHSGTTGVPVASLLGSPVVGTTVLIQADNSWGQPTTMCLILGLQSSSFQLPSGATLLVDHLDPRTVIHDWPMGTTVGEFPMTIPLSPDLCGEVFFLQVGIYDPGATGGMAMTQGLQITIGA